MPPDEFLSALYTLCEDWKKSEKWTKQGEQWVGKVITPSINELRYAGRQITEAISAYKDNNYQTAKGHIGEARKSLIKARHDVVDTMIGYISDEAREIRKELGKGSLQEKFPKYGEFFGLLKTVHEKFSDSRTEEKSRDEIYSDIMDNDLPKLKEYYDELEASYFSAIYERTKQRKKTAKTIFWIGVCGLVFGAINVINRIFW